MPRKTKKFIYLGFLEEMLFGAVAALLIVLYTAPNNAVEKILLSLIAGIGGETILTKLKPIKENSDQE